MWWIALIGVVAGVVVGWTLGGRRRPPSLSVVDVVVDGLEDAQDDLVTAAADAEEVLTQTESEPANTRAEEKAREVDVPEPSAGRRPRSEFADELGLDK